MIVAQVVAHPSKIQEFYAWTNLGISFAGITVALLIAALQPKARISHLSFIWVFLASSMTRFQAFLFGVLGLKNPWWGVLFIIHLFVAEFFLVRAIWRAGKEDRLSYEEDTHTTLGLLNHHQPGANKFAVKTDVLENLAVKVKSSRTSLKDES